MVANVALIFGVVVITFFVSFAFCAVLLFACSKIISSCCSVGRVPKYHRGKPQHPQETDGPSVTVTTTTAHQVPVGTGAAVGSPPYPLDARHPTPNTSGPPAPGFATHSAPYPTNMPYGQPVPARPYPQQPMPYGAAAVYPPAHGAAPYPPVGGAPYPPAPYPSAADNINPPPYDVAVSSPPVQPPVKEAYGKQSPYNPSYN